MSTHSTVGYLDESGNFRGTFVHFNGFDGGSALSFRSFMEGYKAMVEWIEKGIDGGGYSTFESIEPNGRDAYLIDLPTYFKEGGLEYGWLMMPDGSAINTNVVSVEEHLGEEKKRELASIQCFKFSLTSLNRDDLTACEISRESLIQANMFYANDAPLHAYLLESIEAASKACKCPECRMNGYQHSAARVLDAEGYDKHGFDVDNIHANGYRADGYDTAGIDREGWNRSDNHSISLTEFNPQGFKRNGLDAEGYDFKGFNYGGWNRDGINEFTYTRFDRQGYDVNCNRKPVAAS